MKRKIILSVFLVLSVLGISCRKSEKPREMTIPVKTVSAFRGKLVESHEFLGVVQPFRTVALTARVGGFILERPFREGSFVKKDDLLYRIEPYQYEYAVKRAGAEVVRARAEELNASLEYKRIEDLFRQKITSPKNYDSARADFHMSQGNTAVAEAVLKQAELNLSYTEIRAPFDGWIGLTRLETGNFVAADSLPLAEISMVGKVKVEFHIPDRRLTGQLLADLSGGKCPDWPVSLKTSSWTGKIVCWDNRLASDTATLKVQAEFENPEHSLIPGMFVTVTLRNPVEADAVFLDSSALRMEQTYSYVLILNSRNEMEPQRVTVGERVGNLCVILSGLSGGESVILPGNPFQRAGGKAVAVK